MNETESRLVLVWAGLPLAIVGELSLANGLPKG